MMLYLLLIVPQGTSFARLLQELKLKLNDGMLGRRVQGTGSTTVLLAMYHPNDHKRLYFVTLCDIYAVTCIHTYFLTRHQRFILTHVHIS